RIEGRPEPVRRNLIAALDECLHVPKSDPATRQWLFAALGVADQDAWRSQARAAGVARDWDTLERLAREAEVEKQPPSFLLLVAFSLPAHMKSARLGLFRLTQAAHSANLWANVELAVELHARGRPAEAVRY